MVHDLKTLDIQVRDEEHVSLSYSGTLVVMPLIDYNSLNKKSKEAILDLKNLQERSKESMALSGDVAIYKTQSWLDAQKVEEIDPETGEVHISNTKKGSGRLADAMILANAIRGMSITEIQAQRYPYKKDNSADAKGRGILYRTKYVSRRKVFDALSVNKPDDLNRINSLLNDFPEVFKGLDKEQVYQWVQKKANKGGRKS